DEDAGGGEGSGQDGVIRRPRPVPAPGAAEHSGSVDDAAGPRLLDQQLDGLAQSVGRDHAESSQRQEPEPPALAQPAPERDRKSTRLNSSHVSISYAVFCLKKKKKHRMQSQRQQEYRT